MVPCWFLKYFEGKEQLVIFLLCFLFCSTGARPAHIGADTNIIWQRKKRVYEALLSLMLQTLSACQALE